MDAEAVRLDVLYSIGLSAISSLGGTPDEIDARIDSLTQSFIRASYAILRIERLVMSWPQLPFEGVSEG